MFPPSSSSLPHLQTPGAATGHGEGVVVEIRAKVLALQIGEPVCEIGKQVRRGRVVIEVVLVV